MSLNQTEADEIAELIARDLHRLDALREKQVLDSPADPEFDRLTRLAANLLNVPIALVTLIDRDRQFFMSECGLTGAARDARQTPLSHSYCKHVVASREPLVIEDSRIHPFTRSNPATLEGGIGSYAGVPLIDHDGYALGTFCAADFKPRSWNDRDLAILRTLAVQALAEIELRSRAERLHQDLARAREVEAQRMQFTRLTVHDLRTPLTSLRFTLETLPDMGPLAPEQREYLQLSIRSARMLGEIVDTLLDMEAIAVRGPFALSCAAVSPNDLANDALEQVRGAALHRQITLCAELAPELPTVSADRQKLTRVLVNLLGNAVKFTRPGGRVTLRTRLSPGWLRFEVIDTGIGIPAAEQEKIFREGVCLNAAATSYESVGLGLTFCRRIMEAHGGTIQVTSEQGRGSTFSIALPLSR